MIRFGEYIEKHKLEVSPYNYAAKISPWGTLYIEVNGTDYRPWEYREEDCWQPFTKKLLCWNQAIEKYAMKQATVSVRQDRTIYLRAGKNELVLAFNEILIAKREVETVSESGYLLPYDYYLFRNGEWYEKVNEALVGIKNGKQPKILDGSWYVSVDEKYAKETVVLLRSDNIIFNSASDILRVYSIDGEVLSFKVDRPFAPKVAAS